MVRGGKETSRRAFLKTGAAGVGGAITLAGCLGGGTADGGGSGDSGGSEGSDGSSGGSGDGGGSSGGSGSSSNGGGGSGKKTTWRLGTHKEGGGTWSMGPAWGTLIEKYSDKVKLDPQATQGFIHNMRLMDQQNFELGFAHSYVHSWLYNQQGPFEENPVDVRPVQSFPTFQTINHHFLVKRDSGIETLEDLEGKSVHGGVPGSSLEILADKALSAAGVRDSVDFRPMSWTEAQTAFRSDKVVVFWTGVINMGANSATVELWETEDVDILRYSEDTLDTMISENPWWSKVTLDPSHPMWTKGMDTQYDEVTLPMVNTLVGAQRDLDPDLLYDTNKVVHEHQSELQEFNKNLWWIGFGEGEIDGFEFERMGTAGALSDVPFHPGFADYLKDIGRWNSDWKVA